MAGEDIKYKISFIAAFTPEEQATMGRPRVPIAETLSFSTFTKTIDDENRRDLADKLQLFGLTMHSAALCQRAVHDGLQTINRDQLQKHMDIILRLRDEIVDWLRARGVIVDVLAFARAKDEEIQALPGSDWAPVDFNEWLSWFHDRFWELR